MTRPSPTPDDILGGRARVPEHVVYRAFEAETLLLNLRTSQYHGLNPTGSRMLALLDETGGDVGEAVTRLAAEYDVVQDEIAGELATFCGELVGRGLLELEPARE